MKIIFSGGGTLGPVTPLLAIHEAISGAYPDAEFVWVGTKRGPERELVEAAGIPFVTLASGKFRRYFSLWNITDIVRVMIGFFQSMRLIWKEAPDLCISAGAFISVPLHIAAWLFGVRTWIHQQDVHPSLANRIMTPFAKKITVVLKISFKNFPKRKTEWIGNPVRSDIGYGDRGAAQELFNLAPDVPVVFATGGGTGSLKVNQLIIESIPHLEGICQVIHLSGKERPRELAERTAEHFSYYHSYLFFTHEMQHAYAAADMVISRGGFGTLTEIAALAKPAIIIPKPGHQVENVAFLEKAGAIMYLDEDTADGTDLAYRIKELLADAEKRRTMGLTLRTMLPSASPKKLLEIVDRLVL